MSGAISLAGLSALRTGAGLVTLAVPDRCLETVATFTPCSMTVPLPDDALGRVSWAALDIIQSWYQRASCIAIGPGLGRSDDLQKIVQEIVRSAPCPVVIDADALNNLADCRALAISLLWAACAHSASRRMDAALRCSRRTILTCSDHGQSKSPSTANLTIVLKGHESLVTDGKSMVLNQTGTPAMATAGSGDVLTGIITALICQGLATRDAAHLGVHVHGLAGQLAVESTKCHVVLATELVGYLPAAFALTRRVRI